MTPSLEQQLMKDYFEQTCPSELRTLFFFLATLGSNLSEEKNLSQQAIRQIFHQAVLQYQTSMVFPEIWIDDADLPF